MNLKKHAYFRKNQRFVFHYPTTTNVRNILESEFRRREVFIRGIRDLVYWPLTPVEFVRRPLVHRGRYMIRGTDLLSGGIRQFYEVNCLELFRLVPLRVGLFEEYGQRPTYVFNRTFFSAAERMSLAMAIGKGAFNHIDGMKIGVFADDLRTLIV